MADLHPLSDVEKCYWSSQAFQRCLRATKWDYPSALKRAEETLVWRREFQVEEMTEEEVWREGETGKELVFGYDVNCRPVLYMVSRSGTLMRGRDDLILSRRSRHGLSGLTDQNLTFTFFPAPSPTKHRSRS
jgi:hypothetical protein